MDLSVLKVLGQVAGVAGIALGVALLVFRDVIRKQIFATLTKEQSYRLLRLLVILTWSLAVVGVGAWLWATIALNAAPAPQPSSTFRIRDSKTNDPVMRPLSVECSVAGVRLPAQALSETNRGDISLPARREDIRIEAVLCEGYSFVPGDQPQLAEGTIVLQRNDDIDKFSDAIAPSPTQMQFVSLEDYNQAMQNQHVDDGIKLSCLNQTQYHLDLVLVRWMPEKSTELRTERTHLATCPPGQQPKQYTVHDYQPGGYYYVFGSVCGLRAQPLVSGNLHGPPDPTLVVTPGAAGGTNLRAVLKYQ